MSRVRRVVIDTSTLVSAAIRPGSASRLALLEALGSCHVCASAETISELEVVLNREKFNRYLDLEARQEFLALIRRSVHFFAVPRVETIDPPCRDSKDEIFLALAMTAEADILISGDEDLLILNPWHGIPILRASEFLASCPT